MSQDTTFHSSFPYKIIISAMILLLSIATPSVYAQRSICGQVGTSIAINAGAYLVGYCIRYFVGDNLTPGPSGAVQHMMRQGSVHELEMQIEGTVPVDSIVETISDGMPRPAVRNSVVSEGDSLEGNSLEGLSLKAFYGSHKTAQGYAGGIGAVVGVVAATAVCVKGGGGCNHLRGLAHSGARVALSASNLRAISPIAYGIGFTAINSGSKIASLHAGGNLNVRNGLIAVGISSLEAVSDMYWMAGVDRAFILIHANFGGDFLLVPGVADYVGEARAMDEIYDGVQLKRWISRSSEIFPIVGEALLYSHVTGSNATVGEIVGSTLVYQGSRIGIASFRNTGHLYGRNIGDILTGWW